MIESYFPVYTTRLVRALWDDIEATAVFSIQLYESYKHFYALNRYLDIVNYRPLSAEELIDIRRRNLDTGIDDPVAELTRYMLSEHFAAYFFLRVSQQAREPVLARPRALHRQGRVPAHAVRLRPARRPPQAGAGVPRSRFSRPAAAFRHVGADVVPSVPVSEKNDLPAILTLNRRMRRLCGISLIDYAKGSLADGKH